MTETPRPPVRQTPEVGLCGDAAWIADELWRMSERRSRAQREVFFQAVMNLVVVSQASNVARVPPAPPPPHPLTTIGGDASHFGQ